MRVPESPYPRILLQLWWHRIMLNAIGKGLKSGEHRGDGERNQ
jgi:hypothetical protein